MQGKIPFVAFSIMVSIVSGCSSRGGPEQAEGMVLPQVAELPAPMDHKSKTGKVAPVDLLPAPRPKQGLAGKVEQDKKRTPSLSENGGDDVVVNQVVQQAVKHSVDAVLEEMANAENPALGDADVKVSSVVEDAIGSDGQGGSVFASSQLEVPELSLSGGWRDDEQGFVHHAARSREMMASGRPEIAAGEAREARKLASIMEEEKEADALLLAASVMMGRIGDESVLSGLDGDWETLAVLRKGLQGIQVSNSAAAIRDISGWPRAAAANVIVPLAAAVRTKEAAGAVAALAQRLRAANEIDETTLQFVSGYEALRKGDPVQAYELFTAASEPNPRRYALAARARLEALQAGIALNEINPEEIVRRAMSVAGAGAGSWVEEAALRIGEKYAEGENSLETLNRLRRIVGQDEVAKIDLQIAQVEASMLPAKEVDVSEKNEGASAGLQSNDWLLEDDTFVEPEKTVKADVGGEISEVDMVLNRADSLIKDMEEGL